MASNIPPPAQFDYEPDGLQNYGQKSTTWLRRFSLWLTFAELSDKGDTIKITTIIPWLAVESKKSTRQITPMRQKPTKTLLPYSFYHLQHFNLFFYGKMLTVGSELLLQIAILVMRPPSVPISRYKLSKGAKTRLLERKPFKIHSHLPT